MIIYACLGLCIAQHVVTGSIILSMIYNYCTNFAGDFIVFTSLECNLRWSLGPVRELDSQCPKKQH